MKITITFDTDNDAFYDGNHGEELTRILKKAAEYIAMATVFPGATDSSAGTLLDSNGNTVGNWTVEAS